MPHRVGGYDLTFTHRKSWKAYRRQRGKLIDTVPVVWTKGWREDSLTNVFLEVAYQDASDMEAQLTSSEPFVVALAIAKDYKVHPHSFKEFVGLFEVSATGKSLSEGSIEAKVIRRIRA